MTRLVSPTLLDSFAYYQGIEDEERHEQSRLELLNRLRGIKTPATKLMQRGIDFERAVCEMADGTFDNKKYASMGPNMENIILRIVNIIKGAERQVHIGYQLNEDTYIHGYIDFLLPCLIVDTKTTGRYEFGKYISNSQHATYLCALNHLGVRRFKYLTAIFSRGQAVELVEEEYYYHPSMPGALKSRCAEFFDYLTIDAEMSEAYYSRDNSIPWDLKNLIIKGAA